ncbi:MAG: hypothetical protein ACQETI_03790 [Halobacteriota archaeon]
MSNSDTQINDRITEIVLGGSVYERVRLTRATFFQQSIPQKIRWVSGVLFVLALVVPIASTLPEPIRAGFPGGAPLSASPVILILGAFGGVMTTGAGLALVGVGVRRIQLEPNMTEAEASRLLNVEEFASVIGLTAGAIAVVVAVAFFLIGHSPELLASWVEAGGRNPFIASGLGVEVGRVGTVALVWGIVLLAASRYLDRELGNGFE